MEDPKPVCVASKEAAAMQPVFARGVRRRATAVPTPSETKDRRDLRSRHEDESDDRGVGDEGGRRHPIDTVG